MHATWQRRFRESDARVGGVHLQPNTTVTVVDYTDNAWMVGFVTRQDKCLMRGPSRKWLRLPPCTFSVSTSWPLAGTGLDFNWMRAGVIKRSGSNIAYSCMISHEQTNLLGFWPSGRDRLAPSCPRQKSDRECRLPSARPNARILN